MRWPNVRRKLFELVHRHKSALRHNHGTWSLVAHRFAEFERELIRTPGEGREQLVFGKLVKASQPNEFASFEKRQSLTTLAGQGGIFRLWFWRQDRIIAIKPLLRHVL